jgi:ESCRT-I complex subunit TSG101
MTEAELKGYSKKNKYKYKDQTTKDVLGAILKFKDLKLLVDSLIENNGQATKLICLDGTIPINSMGTTYNIPVRVWLRPDYPSRPPICYVRPTQNMSIRVSRHVDKSGLIYLRYLREWGHPSCHLSGVIEAMCTAFGDKLPVWQKPSGQAPQRPLSSPPGVHRILLHRALPPLPPGAKNGH